MKFRNILFVIVIFFITEFRAQNFNWAFKIGGPGGEEALSTTVDPSGNVLVLGYYTGTVDFDPGPGVYNLTSSVSYGYDGYIAKYTANGALIWVKDMKNTNTVLPVSVKVDALGDVYVTGSISDTTNFDPGFSNFKLWPATPVWPEFFVAKWSSSGNFAWAKKFGTADIAGYPVCRIAFDNTGNIIIAGSFDRPGDFDTGPSVFTLNPYTLNSYDAFVLKLDPSGNFIWADQLGGTQDDYGNSVDVDASGNIFMTGYFEGTADMDPGPGTMTITAAGPKGQYVAALTPAGNLSWVKKFDGAVGTASGYGIKLNAAGEIFLAGQYTGTVDFDPGPSTYTLPVAGSDALSVVKLDGSGNFIWANGALGGSGAIVMPDAITVDANSDVYAVGGFIGIVDFDPSAAVYTLSTCASATDVFIQKLTSAGNFDWAVSLGGCGGGEGRSIAVDNYYNVYTVGLFLGLSDFDPGPSTYNILASGQDGFVSKLSPTCTTPASPVNASQPAALNLCGSGSTTLTAGGPSYFLWYSSPSSINSIASGSVYATPVLPVGTYTYYVDAITCATSVTRTPVTVTVSALPSVSVTVSSSITCSSPAPGPAVNLTGNPSGGVYSGPYVSGAVFNSSLAIIPGGTYTVSYTYTDAVTGCSSMASTTIVAASCTGVNELGASSDRIVIYPNPTKENFNVQIDSDLTDGTISIMNALGENIMSQQIRQGVNEIKCRDLAPGIYLYIISEANVPLDKGRIVIE